MRARVLCVCVVGDTNSNAHFYWHFGVRACLPVCKKQRVEKVWKDWKLSVKLVKRKAKSATFGFQYVTFSPHFNHLYGSQMLSVREKSLRAATDQCDKMCKF